RQNVVKQSVTRRTKFKAAGRFNRRQVRLKRRRKMKKQAYTLIALLVLVGSMAVAARAQGGSRTQLVATIPFEFSIGDKTMPAGEYTVRQVNPSSDRAVLQLRSQDGKASAIVEMNALIDKAKAQE